MGSFVVKVFEDCTYTFVPSVDRELDISLLSKGQQEAFLAYAQARHPLPRQLQERLHQTLYHETCFGRLQWYCCLTCCNDHKSWDMDRDPDELLQHIRGQLAGLLETWQYELLESIGIGQTWRDGRPILKLWLKDPQRYEA